MNAVVRAYVRWHDANQQLATANSLKDLNSQFENRYRERQLNCKEQMLFERRHPEVLESAPGGMISKALEVLRNELTAAPDRRRIRPNGPGPVVQTFGLQGRL